jgi:polyisoprenoid-binding protein YceI
VAPFGQMTAPGLRARLADGSLAGLWALDPARCTVALRSRSMWGLASVKGSFGEVSGEAAVSAAGEVSGTIRIGSASVDTKISRRDAHLRSAEFFDSDTYPHIIFTAQRVTLTSEAATVTGTLQVRDRTRPLTFPVTVPAPGGQTVQLGLRPHLEPDGHGVDDQHHHHPHRLHPPLTTESFMRALNVPAPGAPPQLPGLPIPPRRRRHRTGQRESVGLNIN